jgi:hypothetical protein
MKNHIRHITALLVIITSMLACSSSFNVVETQPSSVPENTQAAETSNEPPVLLPQPLYYLGKDTQGLMQVFRVDPDGKTTTQLTHESINVLDYDISPIGGQLAYEVDNQLIIVNTDGSNRRVLTEGAPRSITRGYYNPVFAPNGQTLAYNAGGLMLYNLSTGITSLVLEDQPLGGSLPPAIYTPDKFSPDGTKLLLEVGHPPDSPWSAALFSVAENSLIPITGDDPSLSCCTMYGGAEWSIDSASLYAVATVPDSSTPFGTLWNVEAATGAVSTLIPGSAGDGNMVLFYQTYKPHLATTGQLYFFSAKYPEATGNIRRAPLLLIRSKPDDIINNWTILRGDTFEMMNEALWAPDGSFVVVAFTPGEDVYEGGRAEIVYSDGRPNVVLAPFAQQLKWGS